MTRSWRNTNLIPPAEAVTPERGRLGPEVAAALMGLSVAELLELASDGRIHGAILDASGWHFDRRGMETFLTRRDKGRQDAA
jgi:hypothetical protein